MSSRVPAPAQRSLPDAPGHPGLLARLKSRRNPWKRPTGPGRPHLAKARGETSATLPAAGRPLAGSLSDPLMALGGWVGTLAPHEAAPRSPARRGCQRQKLSRRGQKRKRKYRSTPYSPQRSVRTPKLCPGTALGVLGKLREPCAVRARPNPSAVAPRYSLSGTETAEGAARALFERKHNT